MECGQSPPATPDRGSESAFLDAVARAHPGVTAVARRVAGNDEDAAELVQETYLKAWQSLSTFRGEALLSTWIHRIAWNTALGFARKRGRRPRMVPLVDGDLPGGDHPTANPERWVEHVSDRSELAAAVRSLPPSLAGVVVLKDVEGLTHDEVGDRLGISQGAAKVRLHRARGRLRAQLQGAGVSP